MIMIEIDVSQSVLSGFAGAAVAGAISAIRSATRAQERQLATCEFLLDRLPSAMTDADLVLVDERTPSKVRTGVLLVLRMMHDDRLAKSFLASIGEESALSSADEQSFAQQLAQLHVDAPDLGAAAQRAIMTGVVYLASAHADPRIAVSVANESATNPDGVLSKVGASLKGIFKSPDNGMTLLRV